MAAVHLKRGFNARVGYLTVVSPLSPAEVNNELSGTASLAFTGTGNIEGVGDLSGSVSVAFRAIQATGSLVGYISGSSSIDFTPSGYLNAVAYIAGSASMQFATVTANIEGIWVPPNHHQVIYEKQPTMIASPWVSYMHINKDPSEVLNLSIQWAPRLGNDTISTSNWSESSGVMTLSGASSAGSVSSVNVSGGTAGNVYRVENSITTSGGETLVRSFIVTVKDL